VSQPQETEADVPARRESRGTWIAVIAVFAFTSLATVVAAFAMNRAIDESPVPAWGRKVGEGADLLLDAETAPGVSQLRELGCSSASILDVERMLDFLAKEEGGATPRPQDPPLHAARCWADRPLPPAGSVEPAPVDCAAVARTVAERAPLRGDFAAIVIAGDRRAGETICAERYDQRGAHLGAFAPESLPLP
jgi:hypothetical protein